MREIPIPAVLTLWSTNDHVSVSFAALEWDIVFSATIYASILGSRQGSQNVP